MRRVPSLLTLVLVIALTLVGCARQPVGSTPTGSTPTGSPPQVTVGLTYIPDIQFAPFYVAEQKGLFEQAGLEVSLRHHGASEGLFNALLDGEEDYVLAGGDELLQARAAGMDLVAIGQYYRAYPVVVIVPEDSDIHRPRDLAGRRIGVPFRSGETWFGLQALLADVGLTTEEIEIVEIGYTQQAALATGEVDAVVGFVNNDQVQFQQAEIPVRSIQLTESGAVPLVSIVLATTQERLAARPEVAQKVVGSMGAGIRATVEAPASAVEMSESYIPTLTEVGAESAALATLEATLPLWTPGGGEVSTTIERSDWSQMATFMEQRGLISRPVTAEESMQNLPS
ncbi:MAG: ABC transporter substrate-binding protein [Propioniciclava sp.]